MTTLTLELPADLVLHLDPPAVESSDRAPWLPAAVAALEAFRRSS